MEGEVGREVPVRPKWSYLEWVSPIFLSIMCGSSLPGTLSNRLSNVCLARMLINSLSSDRSLDLQAYTYPYPFNRDKIRKLTIRYQVLKFVLDEKRKYPFFSGHSTEVSQSHFFSAFLYLGTSKKMELL